MPLSKRQQGTWRVNALGQTISICRLREHGEHIHHHHRQTRMLRTLVKQPWSSRCTSRSCGHLEVDDCVVLWARRGEVGSQGDEVLSELEDAQREELLCSSQRGICECSGAVCSDGTLACCFSFLYLLLVLVAVRYGWARISKASACWPSTRPKRLQRVPEHSVATFPHWPACRHCPALADATVPHWLPPAPARCQWLPGQQAGA